MVARPRSGKNFRDRVAEDRGGLVQDMTNRQAQARFVWPYLRRYRGSFVRGFGALIVKDLLAASLPLTIGAAIDALTRGRSMETLLRFAALLVAISAVKGFFQYWMRVTLIGISRDVEFDLRNDLFA